MGHLDNECADSLAKAATGRSRMDMTVKLIPCQITRILLARTQEKGLVYWNLRATDECSYQTFSRISLRQLQCNIHINQLLTKSGTSDDHKTRLRNKLNCSCCYPDSTIGHCLYEYKRWDIIRKIYFPKDC